MKKKTIFAIFIGAALIMATISFNSCTKQENEVRSINGQAQQMEPTPEDMATFNKIMGFKKKMEYIRENPMYKSGEQMSVDSAKWYLDATFNLTYSFINETFTSFNTDTFSISISKSDEVINMDDICIAFYELKDKAMEIYNATDGEYKELYSSHMKITSNTDDEVVLKTTATIGTRTNELPPPPSGENPFEEGDDWMYGVYDQHLGDCDGNYLYEYDAAIKIKDATMTYRYEHDQIGPGLNVFYTEPTNTAELDVLYGMGTYSDLLVNPNDDIVDNYEDYLLLYQAYNVGNGVHKCIEWGEMNFYFNGVYQVIYDIVQEHPEIWQVHSNLSFYECTIEGHGEGGDIYNPTYAHHKLNVTYKMKHYLGISNQPVSINEQ